VFEGKCDDLLEPLDGVGELHVLPGRPGEYLGHVERLREEALHLAGAGDHQLLILGELVHPEDGDDVLKIPVALQRLLHRARDPVMLLADDLGVEDAAGGIERVHRGVDAELGNSA
jgi:hypothetical protein